MNTYCVQTLRETLKKTHLWVIEALPPNCPQSEVQPLTELLIRAKQPWSLQAQGEDSSQICSISHPPIYYYLFFLQGSLISFSFFWPLSENMHVCGSECLSYCSSAGKQKRQAARSAVTSTASSPFAPVSGASGPEHMGTGLSSEPLMAHI